MPPRAEVAAWVAGLALLAPPAALLVLSLYGEHGLFFWDARTLPCGLAAQLTSGDPNAYLNRPDYAGACAGYHYEYMLPPALTSALAPILGQIGESAFMAVYGLAYAAAVVALLRSPLQEPARPGGLLVLAALTACGVFFFEFGSGNLAILFLGALIALLRDPTSASRLAAASALCALAALAKPQFALYLLVPWFTGGSLLAATAGLAGATLAYVADALLQPAAFDRWATLVIGVVYAEPHFGLLRLVEWLTPNTRGWTIDLIAMTLWAALLLALLWRRRSALTAPADRVMAALLVVTLLQPRLKEYDAVVLIPIFFWLDARLPRHLRTRMRQLIALLALAVPALWWWSRKVRLLVDAPPATLTQWADPVWMIAHQGVFLTAAALILFAFMIGAPTTERR